MRLSERRAGKGREDSRVADPFFEPKSLGELTAEQHVRPVDELEQILGSGASLWEDDCAFEEFLAAIYARRREDSRRE